MLAYMGHADQITKLDQVTRRSRARQSHRDQPSAAASNWLGAPCTSHAKPDKEPWGFGFIAPDSNFLDDVYVNESNLQESGIDKLETGDRLSFELLPKHPAHSRRRAVNLKIMESSHG